MAEGPDAGGARLFARPPLRVDEGVGERLVVVAEEPLHVAAADPVLLLGEHERLLHREHHEEADADEELGEREGDRHRHPLLALVDRLDRVGQQVEEAGGEEDAAAEARQRREDGDEAAPPASRLRLQRGAPQEERHDAGEERQQEERDEQQRLQGVLLLVRVRRRRRHIRRRRSVPLHFPSLSHSLARFPPPLRHFHFKFSPPFRLRSHP